MSGEDEAYVGRRVFTSSENVKMDDAEVEANEQMMKNAKCVLGGGVESFLSARWRSSWHFSHYCGDGFSRIAPSHARAVTGTRAEPPPVTLRHLPGNWSSKRRS